jgi:polysaccharide biosynthesis protein PslJ
MATMTTTAVSRRRPRALPSSTLPGWATPPRGWQPYAIFLGLPLWWLAGLSFFMWPLIVAPIVYPLLRRGEVRAPRRFGIWLLFVAWMIASGVELQSASRVIAWSWRLSFYLSATVLFLWIYNASRERVPTRAIINGLAGFWVFVIYGGWLAVLYPTLQLHSPAEYIFPHSLLDNTYFYAHVHLQVAQLQRFLGFEEGRPQTFFAYTNAWGSTCAMLTPLALAALAAKPGPVWGRVLKVTLGLSVVPIIFSLNRGLWLSLGFGLAYAAVRFGALRDVQRVMRVLGAVVLVGVVIAFSPLGGLVSGRFTHQTGDTSRLARDQAAQSQVAASPWLGYGAPQQNKAVTHTDKSVGTESEIFLLLYSHGLPALFLYGAWMAYTILRTAKTRSRDSPPIFWVHVALIVAFVQSPYYELTERIPFMLVFAALLYRDIAMQSELRFEDRVRARERLRGWRMRRPPAPAPALTLDGD